jgi:hypothetical protein
MDARVNPKSAASVPTIETRLMSLVRSRSTWHLKRPVRIATFLIIVVSATTATWGGTVADLPLRTRAANHELGNSDRAIRGNVISIAEEMHSVGIVPLILGQLNFASGTAFGPGGIGLSLLLVGEAGRGGMNANFPNAKIVDGERILDAETLHRSDLKLATFLNLSGAAYGEDPDRPAVNFEDPSPSWVHDRLQHGLLTDCKKSLPEPASIVLLGLSLAILGAARLVRH